MTTITREIEIPISAPSFIDYLQGDTIAFELIFR
jgi:hypothetical protein